MTLIERQILLKRRQIVKRGIPIFINAIKEQYHQALSIIQTTPIDQLEGRIKSSVNTDPIQRAFESYYPMASDFGVMWHNKLMGQKAETDQLYHAKFKRTLKQYATEKAGQRITGITETTEDAIIGSVRNSLNEGLELGLSVDKIRNQIIEEVIKQGEQMTRTRAQMISQTEMVSASNMAASEAAKDVASQTGMQSRKFWSTSGLPNVRDSHIAAEEESIRKNGLDEGETFDSCPGMEYPGDPNGDASNVINCHCSILYELI